MNAFLMSRVATMQHLLMVVFPKIVFSTKPFDAINNRSTLRSSYFLKAPLALNNWNSFTVNRVRVIQINILELKWSISMTGNLVFQIVRPIDRFTISSPGSRKGTGELLYLHPISNGE